ncbi:unnamed protein product [Cylicostephanus goldi]|uniref:Uncharacterized protein n=1 Tax=Cylicostephanus goldi TaxID=71465 RepID=A0A3P6TS32_CYLGO|nr:unnamed protein product [Cylicostephanus goldi]
MRATMTVPVDILRMWRKAVPSCSTLSKTSIFNEQTNLLLYD